MELFEQLLASSEQETVLAGESDPELTLALTDLWKHHISASQESYLDMPVKFEVAPVFSAGRLLLGRFRIERLLGQGGMGEVYLAWDERVGDWIAIKTIARLLTPSKSIRERFISEVQNARRVTHSNVCRIHELFEDGETAFLSMEYLEGVPLSEPLPWTPKQARAIVRQMADGLRAAHRMGVVHGDFKPGNIMIVGGTAAFPVRELRTVVMDFGLARAIGGKSSQLEAGLSTKGGTLNFMAPELLDGGAPNVASDIYALGKVAAELLPKERIWKECTQSDPQLRPASLEKVIRRLDSSLTRRFWIPAAAAVVTGTAGYLLQPPTHRGIDLPATARILVNGFQSIPDQLASARLTRSLFLTALLQSPRIRAIADEDLFTALQQLKPGGTLPLADAALSDLLTQLRAAFWIEGELRKLSGRYSLDLRLLSARGRSLVTNASFRDEPSVVALAKRAALWVRQIAGESEQSLSLNPADVGSYTSQVPEALQRYYDAMEQYTLGKMDQALPLLEEALRLDPNFPQAHCLLALILNASWRYDDAFREIDTAFRLADKLPERERSTIQMYYYRITGDPVRMIAFAKQAVAYRPDEPRSYASLGRTLADSGNAVEALDQFRKALTLAPDDWMQLQLLAEGQVEAGQYLNALETFRSAQAKKLPVTWIYNAVGSAYMGLGRYDEAERAFAREPFDSENSADVQGAKIMQGHLETAVVAMQEQLANSHTHIERHSANEFLCGLYFVTGRLASARKHVRAMADLPAFPPMAALLNCTASWARRLSDDQTLAIVRATLGEMARRWPNAYTQAAAEHVNALALWQRGALDDAESLLLNASGLAFNIWTLFDLAEFFTKRAKWEIAEEYWARFETRQGVIINKGFFPGILVSGWLYRASVGRSRNDWNTAAHYSKLVIDQWSTSNPRIPIVRAARNILSIAKTNQQ